MAGLELIVEVSGLAAAQAKLNALGAPGREREIQEIVGAVVESQTRRRIAQEKTSPDGVAWAPWSASYKTSRRKGHSLLQETGALMDSIAWRIEDDQVLVGTNLVYGAIHQFGGTEGMKGGAAHVPARPYLGLSAQNVTEIGQTLSGWIEGLLQ